MTYCDYEPAQFYSEKCVVARKPHKCCETGRIIQPGEKYWRCVGKWEGDLMAFCQSEFAYRFARKINGIDPPNEKYDSCIAFGELRDHVQEMRYDLPAEWVAEWDAEIARLS